MSKNFHHADPNTLHPGAAEHLNDDDLTFGQKIADKITSGIGSWNFIIIQSTIVLIWMVLNGAALLYQWDPYPFTFLNLVFSTQAAYAAPIIMMSQNRQSEKDRQMASHDLHADLVSIDEIKKVQQQLASLELEKLDKILKILEKNPNLLK